MCLASFSRFREQWFIKDQNFFDCKTLRDHRPPPTILASRVGSRGVLAVLSFLPPPLRKRRKRRRRRRKRKDEEEQEEEQAFIDFFSKRGGLLKFFSFEGFFCEICQIRGSNFGYFGQFEGHFGSHFGARGALGTPFGHP